jgi:hypothetical protein
MIRRSGSAGVPPAVVAASRAATRAGGGTPPTRAGETPARQPAGRRRSGVAP